MGNEMGNRNVSGLQEEEKSAVMISKNAIQESGQNEEVEGENHVVPEVEAKDFHVKVAGLSSDMPSVDGDFHEEGNQLSDGKEQDDTESRPLSQQPEIPIELNTAANGTKVQTVASGEDERNHEMMLESNFQENLLETSHQAEKQPISGKEAETSDSILDSNISSNNSDTIYKQSEAVDVVNEQLTSSEHISPPKIDEIPELAGAEMKPSLCINIIPNNNDQVVEKKIEEMIEEEDESQKQKSADMITKEDESQKQKSLDMIAEETSQKQKLFDTDTSMERDHRDLPESDKADGNSAKAVPDNEKEADLQQMYPYRGAHTSSSTFDPDSSSDDADSKSDKMEANEVEVDTENLTKNENQSASVPDMKEIQGLSDGEENGHSTETGTPFASTNIVPENDQDEERESGDLLPKAEAYEEEVDEKLDMKAREEKNENLITEEGGGNGLSKGNPSYLQNNQEAESHLETNVPNDNSADYPVNPVSDHTLESTLQKELLDLLQELPQPQEKCMILEQETKLMIIGLENGENNTLGEVSNELKIDEIIGSPSEAITLVPGCSRNENEFEDDSTSCSEAEKRDQIEKLRMGSQESFIDEHQDSISGEQLKDSQLDSESLFEIGTRPIEFTAKEADPGQDEKKVNETENKQGESLAMESTGSRREAKEQNMVQLKSNDQCKDLPSPIYLPPQHQKEGKIMEPEPSGKKQQSCSEFLTTDASNQSLVTAIDMEMVKPVRELPQTIQTTTMITAETDNLPNQFDGQQNEKNAFILATGRYDERGNIWRHSIESNPEITSNNFEARNSPSFDFDIPLEARSEESDQTPLLVRERPATRSLSGRGDWRFKNPIGQIEYCRAPLHYAAVTVEEKTIRVERSDSEKVRGPFQTLLKDEEKASHGAVKSAAVAESNISAAKEVEAPSRKAGEKRKPRSFIFSTCICCTAATH